MTGEVSITDATQTDTVIDFPTIYSTYQPRIAGYLCRMVGDPDIAADLTQDVFVKAYRAIGHTTPDIKVKAWLFTIATNVALDYHRRRRLLKWLPLDRSDREHWDADPQTRYANREELEAAMSAVPKDHLACLLLQVRDGFSFEEIGDMLGITSGTAKTRAYRARWALARILRREQEGAR